MPSIQLPVLLLCLTLSGVCLNGKQSPPEVSEKMGRSSLDDILQRSRSHMLPSVVKKVEKKEEMNKGIYNIGDIPIEILVRSLAEIISQCIYFTDSNCVYSLL